MKIGKICEVGVSESNCVDVVKTRLHFDRRRLIGMIRSYQNCLDYDINDFVELDNKSTPELSIYFNLLESEMVRKFRSYC